MGTSRKKTVRKKTVRKQKEKPVTAKNPTISVKARNQLNKESDKLMSKVRPVERSIGRGKFEDTRFKQASESVRKREAREMRAKIARSKSNTSIEKQKKERNRKSGGRPVVRKRR